MAADATTPTADAAPEIALESGTYEIIRNRLSGYGKELAERLGRLNEDRKAVFGAIETALVSTERITTQNNCVPRDMVAIGNKFLFGYNVHIGLKTETDLSDVFAVYEFRDQSFRELGLDLLADERFEKEFKDVYRYYKNATFAKFFLKGPHLYIVMRVGKSAADIKTFKWLIQGDSLSYVDSRSDHEVRYPPQHEFEWKRTTRDQHKSGVHPHVSIEDRVFVETVGGDLTIKIENNTDTGEGIYSEPVDDPDQTLDDAEISYAVVGNVILLKIRPYQEQKYRYFIYNDKIQRSIRLDTIEQACVLLPDGHGLIFPNGYYLQTGEHKTFDLKSSGLMFERRIAAPNGEDFLYVFYHRDHGEYVLLHYNLISQQVDTPLICHGFTLFEAGELICFRAQGEPQKHHAVQIWQTPYVGKDYEPPTESDSYLNKIGNKDIVRAMAECHEVLALIDKEDTYANLYVDISKEASDVLDSYFWVNREDTHRLDEPLAKIKEAAAAAVEEFDKVVRVKQNTTEQTKRVRNEAEEILGAVAHRRYEHINDFVQSLADLRGVRGEIISLRELRYCDEALIESLEAQVVEQTDRLSHRCVEFLLNPDALQPYVDKVKQDQAGIPQLEKVADAKTVEEEIAASAAELEMLIEIVSNLKIDDATQRTAIIDNISGIFATVNQARAALKKKTHELASVEGVAEFNSQLKLLNQSVVNYLDICDSPDKCEEFLTKVMIQLEELEGRFAEFDEFIVQLSEKRDEVYNAFESRKLSLIEARNKRAGALAAAADRILKGIKNRVEQFESVNEINSYFASDLMIEKVRDICEQLEELDDSVKVDDIQSRLKTVREDAVRQLKDRKELYVDGRNVIKLGTHQFSVNVQQLDLTTVLRDGAFNLHLTGTNFFEAIQDEVLNTSRDVWDQDVVSENRNVYRGEYLAYKILQQLGERAGVSPPSASNGDTTTLAELRQMDDAALPAFVARFMGPRYSEGYVKGVHDQDAAKLLRVLVEMQATIGLLRFHTRARALGAVFWEHFAEPQRKTLMAAKLHGMGTISQIFPARSGREVYVSQLRAMLGEFAEQFDLFEPELVDEAAEYLFFELASGEPEGVSPRSYTVSRTAADLCDAFQSHLKQFGHAQRFADSVKSVEHSPEARFRLARNWVQAFLEQRGAPPSEHSGARLNDLDYADEVAAMLLRETIDPQCIIDARVEQQVEELAGTHPVIEDGTYPLHYTRFLTKLDRYEKTIVPRFHQFQDRKKSLVEAAREEMKLDEFKPRVLTSFVRNRLLDTVYLPLIGDNLAKQVGAAGEGKRTDRMGLLLLISPPGYGKTTLMEYIANRLGIIFMKINGPAIGHQVTSLDPTEAPNAAAREEVNKLNLALEMGDNVMIYLDDIQHCNPEFLQKFISLCDATRKIEGVYKGKTRTYDLRGRKVAVVMAGNPYTESGEKFQIPDMLSNRADIYNLGEIIGENADAFEMSYLENCLTSNPTLNNLATRSQKDVYAVIKMAEAKGSQPVSSDELEGNYSLEELNEMVAVMKKLIRVRDVILTVNREYIRSAAQSDDYRTEPAFKLQGSYRNMNRIAERVLPIMNDAELESLIYSNYENDAQTLTSDTEANLLKFKELSGQITDAEQKRWDDIKRTFQKNVKMRGLDTSDNVGRVIAQLQLFGDGLDSIRDAVVDGVGRITQSDKEQNGEHLEQHVTRLSQQLQELKAGMQSVGESLSGGISRLAELAAQREPQSVQLTAPMPAAPSFDADAIRQLAAEIRALSPPQSAEPAAPSFDADAIRELASEIRALAPPQPEPPKPRVEVTDEGPDESTAEATPSGQPTKITVVNKIPPTMLNVLQEQFRLMEGWMAPILEATTTQSAELQELKNRLEACLADYGQLVGRMEATKKPAKRRSRRKKPD